MKYSPWPEVSKLRLYLAWNVVEAEEEAADGAGVGGAGGRGGRGGGGGGLKES